jgi:hypothetical protein
MRFNWYMPAGIRNDVEQRLSIQDHIKESFVTEKCGDCKFITRPPGSSRMLEMGYFNCQKRESYRYVAPELNACKKFEMRGLFDPPLQLQAQAA